MDSYLGEIKVFSFPRIPKGWAPCNGQILPIQQNAALYSILGTLYGGDGKTTFALPDLRGRAMLGVGQSSVSGAIYRQGVAGGTESVTLDITQIPQHNHPLTAQNVQGTSSVNNAGALELLAQPVVQSTTYNVQQYATSNTGLTPLMPDSVGISGSSQPHENRVPLMALNVCICINGIYPPRP